MILEELAAAARQRVEEQKKEISPAAMRRMAETMESGGGFLFEEAVKRPGLSFICEVKKASPSKGVIAEDFSLSGDRQGVRGGWSVGAFCAHGTYPFPGEGRIPSGKLPER